MTVSPYVEEAARRAASIPAGVPNQKHTPGPWTAENQWNGINNIHDAAGNSIATLAKNHAGPGPHGVSECNANARLIAAAPDLLAACERVLRAIEWSEPTDRLSAPERADTLRAAIAKVTQP